MSDAALSLTGVTKTYDGAGAALPVLTGVDLNIRGGEVVALVAPSGAGKSTLLHIAGLLDKPTEGSVRIAGEEMSGASEKARTTHRRDEIGFVYQFHHLLPEFSAAENVAMPCRAAGLSAAEARERAEALLKLVGLANRTTHRPAELSGGEQQRVAVARALVNAPSVLLADEPTGNLDPSTAEQVFSLLVGLARETGLASLVATHNHDLAARMDRIVHIENGQIVRG